MNAKRKSTIARALLSLVCCWGIIPAAVAEESPIAGQVGAYAVQTAEQIDEMAKHGFRLSVQFYVQPNSAMAVAMRRAKFHYIDSYPQSMLYHECQDELKSGGVCSQGSRDKAMAIIRKHLQETATDDLIAGYWILDDYPGGDVRQLIEDVRAEIAANNRKYGLNRPAVCGFGGLLDRTDVSWLQQAWSVKNPFTGVASSYTAPACDMIGVYLYGAREDKNPAKIDWKMKSSLPNLLAALRARGWDQARVPLIGMPHAFAYLDSKSRAPYVLPRSQDLAAQSEAFCRAGAIALVAYTWDDRHKGERRELFNSEELRRGLSDGMSRCKRYWKPRR